MNLTPFQGIIFDMDNTLLKSNIDFDKMKKAVYDFLLAEDLIQECSTWKDKTASQWIEAGREHPGFRSIESKVWKLVEEIEAEGMKGAELEPFAPDLLNHLKKQEKMVAILTNNAYSAAREALEELSIFHLFDLVAGREHMETLKPSPSGVHFIMNRWKEIYPHKWVFIGDSWIDGMAAQKAGISFIAYQAEPRHLREKGITPIKHVQNLIQLMD